MVPGTGKQSRYSGGSRKISTAAGSLSVLRQQNNIKKKRTKRDIHTCTGCAGCAGGHSGPRHESYIPSFRQNPNHR